MLVREFSSNDKRILSCGYNGAPNGFLDFVSEIRNFDNNFEGFRVGNVGSSKVIINNGGILENIYYDKEKDESICRYWINLKGWYYGKCYF